MTRARDLADSADKDIAGTLTLDGLTVDGNGSLLTLDNGSNPATLSNTNGNVTLDFDTTNAGRNYTIQGNNLDVFRASNGGDISFYEDTGTTAKFFWDASAESLGIGTSAPDAPLVIEESAVSQVAQSNDIAVFKRNGAGYLKVYSPNTNIGGIAFGDPDDPFIGAIRYQHSTDHLDFYVNNAERMRIDSSGNVGIGTTADQQSSAVNEGIWLSSGSNSSFSANATPLIINRMGTGGNNRANITLHNNGTARADIGTLGASNGLYIEPASSGNGLAYLNTSVSPCQGGGAVSDNYLDLGTSSRRFDDIYATNGTIQTSDANEKQQIASLIDAEITAAKAISKLFKTFKWNSSVAENGDNARTHTGVVAQQIETAMTDAGLNAGNYAFFVSSTWEDEDGNSQTRKGIRYPELLSFIGAATEQRLASIETRLDALEAE